MGLGLETCGLATYGLGMTISESEDLNSDLEKEDLDLPLWDLTTSLLDSYIKIIHQIFSVIE